MDLDAIKELGDDSTLCVSWAFSQSSAFIGGFEVFFYHMCTSICLHVHMCTTCFQCLKSPEEDGIFPGTGVTNGLGVTIWALGSEPRPCAKASSVLNI